MNSLDALCAGDEFCRFPSVSCVSSEEGVSNKHSCCRVLCSVES